ncbi:5-methyltetrahydropteroyltriglutamate--homocysteine S-methyltransferase [Arcticibacterium luteifluviistationis]|uniref:5-methyltetrahydropteroyltriglutamate--homocysteine methyltransferase n=1 Tax=Arcticibacterium luteifluviistationis TaxID=1784714 RepID=A0A2Z4GHG9_9BACT|nr:5-methyltetrahydropteroyltriglutamate--homocysteine S-methyltransferase [Arcticibacterium luteifluviistationis]AWW00707.1 5-methyltetrahydropteroyltriglutamate--homocysteine S-methyltransferase [Arcticibacterium luteifluviistationis]
MLKNNLGFPRIGNQRQLKRACEKYWSGKISESELLETGKTIRLTNWQLQKEHGIDLIPSNDFSFYDQVLDHSLMFGTIPERFKDLNKTDLYFAMARGYQSENQNIKACEMTKWFDTNYHYIVPEFQAFQTFHLNDTKVIDEFIEAQNAGILTKPVLIGPITYLLLGKVKNADFNALSLIDRLLPVYLELLNKLHKAGAEYVQIDEPFLGLDLNFFQKETYRTVYHKIKNELPDLKIILSTYFEGIEDNALAALNLPVDTLHIDLKRAPDQLDNILSKIGPHLKLSLGIIDGRNIWKTDYQNAIQFVQKAVNQLGEERVMIAPSCSLIHVPVDLENETTIDPEIKDWLAFATQKLIELNEIATILAEPNSPLLARNTVSITKRSTSTRIHKPEVKKRSLEISDKELKRNAIFAERKNLQKSHLKLPDFPTTTIGSFPQTKEIRTLRANLKKGIITAENYEAEIKRHTAEVIKWQEELGLDVLVHGEFERNDMVEYFGELLEGFVFSANGWVQSYGSRCVKPPIIFGDIERLKAMTVAWSSYAQSLSAKPMKGMLTGPQTILQWSFVRDDQPRHETLIQLAFAVRDEVADLEKAGLKIIQIDEAALREGLPLKKADQDAYWNHAIKAFKIASAVAQPETQIHTHMCYSQFKGIMDKLADMDADVITIETCRSQMELLESFQDFQYPNEIGPGVYDIHSPTIPSVLEIEQSLEKALKVIPEGNLWVNPDCGLKTRAWPETEASLKNMVQAAQNLRLRNLN